MTQNHPLVSVHLLTYNHAKFIRQSIESVVNQKTNFPFEIIIGDDCSTDGTSLIVDEYSLKYPELIKVVRGKTNEGPQPNSIRILENCKGKYMAALEGDDYWIDELKLQKQVDFMEANPDFAMCFTNTRVEFFEGKEEPYILNQDLEKDVFESIKKDYKIYDLAIQDILNSIKESSSPVANTKEFNRLLNLISETISNGTPDYKIANQVHAELNKFSFDPVTAK